MLKLIDLTYYAESKFRSLKELSERYRSTLGYAEFIKGRIDLYIIKHLNKTEQTVIDGINYYAFTSRNVFAFVPLDTHRSIKTINPDVVLIQGFTFPLQVIFLRRLLGRKPVFLLQYHGGKPCKMPRLILQRLADRFVDAYLFTGKEMADEWIKKGIISGKDKCFELPEGSTDFTRQNKAACKKSLGFAGDYNFLWVGRL